MMHRLALAAALLVSLGCAASQEQAMKAAPGTFVLKTRRLADEKTATWNAKETAVIVCDMWDNHTCQGAVRRVVGFAPKLDAFLKRCRAEGALIIHAPSDVVKFYDGTPQRKRAQDATAVTPPVEIKGRRLIPEKEGQLPVDDSDWCDCKPVKCPVQEIAKKGWPWTRQIALIEIAPEDAISADGKEVWNLFQQRGIKNLIMTGVHTNMCVLGRSFGIRQMTMLGVNTVLARDLTDCLYDPAKKPYVSHDRGTELIVEHIERHWCPSFLSSDIR